MVAKATEAASKVERAAKEISKEVKETTLEPAEILTLALVVVCIGTIGIVILFMVAII